ncbi:MAG: lysoplasmalogenase [Chitinophagaceae bacterium]|nr:lysoplasmalogenase [Chitinophagaceae bacterium]NDE78743.1 lysoplasmalogenase [Chitinophagaceae bacterium]
MVFGLKKIKMNKKIWIALYGVVLLAHLTGIGLESEVLARLTKPHLMVILGFFMWEQTRGIKNRLITVFIAAQFFSWCGDLLLMNTVTPVFFLYGLGAFLLAQLLYSFFFFRVMQKEKIKFSWLLFFPVLIYYSVLISWLAPQLGALKTPVVIYGAIISTMLLLALHMLYMPAVRSGRLFMLGALLFVASDSALAINKFSNPFPSAGLIIMITYGLAQFFLTTGALQYIQRQQSRHSLF